MMTTHTSAFSILYSVQITLNNRYWDTSDECRSTLASMPHLGIVDTNDSILFCARLHLAAALRFFFDVLRDQSPQQCGIGLNRLCLLGMLLFPLLRQAQQAPPILHHLG